MMPLQLAISQSNQTILTPSWYKPVSVNIGTNGIATATATVTSPETGASKLVNSATPIMANPVAIIGGALVLGIGLIYLASK